MTMDTTSAPDPIVQSRFASFLVDRPYAGFDIAQIIEIDGASGDYAKDVRNPFSVDKTDSAFDPLTPQPFMSEGRPTQDSIGSGSVTLDYYSERYDIPRVSNVAGFGIDPEGRAFRYLARRALRRHVAKLGTVIGTAANYTNSVDGPDITTTTNLIMGSILTGVQSAIDFGDGAIDATDIDITINPTVARWLRANDDLRQSLPAGSQDQRINAATLRQAIADETDGANLVVLPQRVVSGGSEGYAMGDHIAITVRGAGESLAFCNTFTDRNNAGSGEDGSIPSLALVEVFKPEGLDGMRAKSHEYHKIQVEHAGAGYLIYDVLS